MNQTVIDAICRLSLRAHLVGTDVLAATQHAILDRHRAMRADDERGAQAAEYAMLGGVSAAACTGLVAILKNRSTLKALVDTVLEALGKVVSGWF